MHLPQIKRDLIHFIRDEKGTMTKKNILKAGLAVGTLVGFTRSAFAYHSDVATQHGNTLTLSYNDPDGVGQHSHHASHVNADLPDGDGGGWLFDCLGTVDNPSLNNIGEFFTWLNGERPHWTLKAYHLTGVLFRIAKINGIEATPLFLKLRSILPPRYELRPDKKSSFVYALAIHGFSSAQKGVHYLAAKGYVEPLLREYLANCSVITENDLKRINWMVAALESAGADTQWVSDHPKYDLLKAMTHHVYVCTSAKQHLGTSHPHASVPDKKLLSRRELFWYYVLTPIGKIISIFYLLGLCSAVKHRGVLGQAWKYSHITETYKLVSSKMFHLFHNI